MEVQKIINLLEEFDDEVLKFQTRKFYIINDQNNGQYGKGDENDSTIKFNTDLLSQIFVVIDAYILVTGNIAVVNRDNNTLVGFTNCSPSIRCVTHLNYEHLETADNLDFVIDFYNL